MFCIVLFPQLAEHLQLRQSHNAHVQLQTLGSEWEAIHAGDTDVTLVLDSDSDSDSDNVDADADAADAANGCDGLVNGMRK